LIITKFREGSIKEEELQRSEKEGKIKDKIFKGRNEK